MTLITDPRLIAVLEGMELVARDIARRNPHLFPTLGDDGSEPLSRTADPSRIGPAPVGARAALSTGPAGRGTNHRPVASPALVEQGTPATAGTRSKP